APALGDREGLYAVLGDDLVDAVVGRVDWAELDLDAAGVVVDRAGGDGGAGGAGGVEFEGEQHRPGLVGGDGDGECVLQLHVTSPGRRWWWPRGRWRPRRRWPVRWRRRGRRAGCPGSRCSGRGFRSWPRGSARRSVRGF